MKIAGNFKFSKETKTTENFYSRYLKFRELFSFFRELEISAIFIFREIFVLVFFHIRDF